MSATTEEKNEARQEVLKFLRRLFQLGAAVAVIWVGFYAFWRRFPYLKPGSEVIYETKMRELSKGRIFTRGDAKLNVVMVGNSITLAGFIPEQFDRQVGPQCQSYNLGLPGQEQYMKELRGMISRGDVPTHVLLQLPWPPRINPKSWRQQLKEDHRIVNTLFPFRSLPRDLAIFLVLSRKDGIADYYAAKKQTAEQMLADRGYYFIEGQSRFKDHRLPDDRTFQTDRPDEVRHRRIETDALAFQELRNLAKQHDIQFILVPSYFREHHHAEPPASNPQTLAALKPYEHFHAVGPDYFRLPNRCFSDPVHVNREGAELYTGRLSDLFRTFLDEHNQKKTKAKP